MSATTQSSSLTTCVPSSNVRRSLSGLRDLRLLIAQLLLQLGELPALELFKGGYMVVQRAGVTVHLG
ncbi:hypothetical protein PC129_g21206 [Phytophthora cactorum]|uniref:Uncharacterized protein n=1 Tax=Phytophthora cactorum TaxID=29920 RepID=A0A329SWP0_9STRA|nr:hypothetical protein Pcac1_g5206 [Phytophthora cactorum]KAG2875721.1 hypothetical protein PC114_g24566 [Phytophthora cactorum]KAG2882760.1 hypothetical protein PC115_g21865 [Phytophthora cactorum]KAG2890930.1 hypothetical protein PC117_g24363 [Phytophthora cactorum]KAG2970506.1 hypothetical protein PC119_g23642 [Phytophthora cactorum]